MIRGIILLVALLWSTAAPAAAEDAYFDSKGVRIHYTIEGEGEPVLLIHGFTSSIEREWRTTGVLPKLSTNYRVIAIDNRGHGKSERLLDPEQYGAEMAGDAVRLLDQLKLPKVHVVGYSMGGLITEYLLVHHPERLHTATLGGMGWIRADDDRMALIGALAVWLDNGQQIGSFLQRFQSADGSKASLPGPLRILLRDDSKALAACARGMPKLAVAEEPLKENRIPTLAVIGEKDPLKVCVDDLKQVMPSLDVKVIPSGDHDTTLRSPLLPEHILTFLAAHPLGAR